MRPPRRARNAQRLRSVTTRGSLSTGQASSTTTTALSPNTRAAAAAATTGPPPPLLVVALLLQEAPLPPLLHVLLPYKEGLLLSHVLEEGAPLPPLPRLLHNVLLLSYALVLLLLVQDIPLPPGTAAASRANASAASARHPTAPNAAARIGAAAPVLAANLSHHFVGETFAQGGTLKKNSDRFALQKCLLEYVFPKQTFYTDSELEFSNKATYCTTQYRASISRSRQYTLLLVSNTTVVHWPCTVFRYTGRLVIQ